jgi:hypothetical protein
LVWVAAEDGYRLAFGFGFKLEKQAKELGEFDCVFCDSLLLRTNRVSGYKRWFIQFRISAWRKYYSFLHAYAFAPSLWLSAP